MKLKLFLLGLLSSSFIGAFAQLKVGDQPTVQQKSVALDIKGSSGKQGLWLPRVSDTTDASGIDGLIPPDGMLIYFTPSQNVLLRQNGVWVPLIKTDTTVNNIYVNGTTKVTGPDIKLKVGNSPGTTNDFNLVGSTSLKEITVNLPDASTTVRGAVTTGAQTLGGQKTLADGVVVNNGSTLNNSTTANGGMNVTGATTNTSNLTLGLTSATAPGTQTNKYLTVDAAGKVTLNSVNAITSVTAGGATMTGPALTYNTGTAGTDFNIASTANTATWNIPDAGTGARGAITTGAQTIGGLKTLANGIVVNNGSTLNNGTTANGGMTVSGSKGVNGATSNLTLGVNSTTVPEGTTDKFLSVNSLGQVTLNAMNITTNNALKIKTYFKNIDGAPVNLPNNTPTRYFFTFTGQNFSTTSSVLITPLFQMKLGTGILYSRVIDANTIEMIMMYYNNGGTQPVTDGTDGIFNITIIEF